MADYNFTTIGPPSQFRAQTVRGNFESLRDLLSPNQDDLAVTGIGDYKNGDRNVPNDKKSLHYTNFRPGALTETFESAAPGEVSGTGSSESFVFLRDSNFATAPDVPIEEWINSYDVAGSGVRCYSRLPASKHIVHSRINIRQAVCGAIFDPAKGNWETLQLRLGFWLRRRFAADAPQTVAFHYGDIIMTDTQHHQPGEEVSIYFEDPGVQPIKVGVVEYWVTLQLDPVTVVRGSGPSAGTLLWDGVQIKCAGAATTVTIVYQ